jgi:hypothetical protein
VEKKLEIIRKRQQEESSGPFWKPKEHQLYVDGGPGHSKKWLQDMQTKIRGIFFLQGMSLWLPPGQMLHDLNEKLEKATNDVEDDYRANW